MSEATPVVWWQVLLSVVTAAGTLGAVVAALLVAHLDRRAADRRAEEDRETLSRMNRTERASEARRAQARWLLDLLLQISLELERFLHDHDRGTKRRLTALIRACPLEMPVLKHYMLEQDLPSFSYLCSLLPDFDVRLPIMILEEDPLDDPEVGKVVRQVLQEHWVELARHEITCSLELTRRALIEEEP